MKFRFSKKEARDIFLSVMALGYLFSYGSLYYFPIALLIVGLAFVCHELSHKFVAIHYECNAEYKLWPQGLLLALLVALLTDGAFIFAAPGAVVISTFYATRLGYKFVRLSAEQSGIISLAGPAVNIVLAFIFTPISFIIPALYLGVVLNLWLALFNLIPIPPLDGSKVFFWHKGVWFAFFLTTIVLMIVLPLLGVLMSAFIALTGLGVFFVIAHKIGLV